MNNFLMRSKLKIVYDFLTTEIFAGPTLIYTQDCMFSTSHSVPTQHRMFAKKWASRLFIKPSRVWAVSNGNVGLS